MALPSPPPFSFGSYNFEVNTIYLLKTKYLAGNTESMADLGFSSSEFTKHFGD